MTKKQKDELAALLASPERLRRALESPTMPPPEVVAEDALLILRCMQEVIQGDSDPIAVARARDLLRSVSGNVGRALNGWDVTDYSHGRWGDN